MLRTARLYQPYGCYTVARIRQYATSKKPRDYDAAVEALNGLQSNFSIVEAIRKLGPGANKTAIPEMVEWVRRIGYQPADFDRLNPIHIAGTKGKGSTASFVSSILHQFLYQGQMKANPYPGVGLYTSPHLRFVRERIQIDNTPITEELFARCFWEIWDRLDESESQSALKDSRNIGGKPVYFHYLTLMALHCFAEQNVTTAVIECGIGGEYDTTNILAKSSVTGITSLGIDHEALLGDTLESIAWHKSGIFRKGVPAFTIQQPAAALEVLHERAKQKGTFLHVVPSHPTLDEIELGIPGDFQKLNASLAIAICFAHLKKLGFSDVPHPLSQTALPQAFVEGLKRTRLGGRCEMRPDRKEKHVTWYIDGGHTLESIGVAGRWFASHSTHHDSSKLDRVLIFNQQTRNASSLAKELHGTLARALNEKRPFRHAIFCSNTTYKGSGYKADLVSINTNKDDVGNLRVQQELAQTWEAIDSQTSVHVVGTIEEAVLTARRLCVASSRAQVLATGSLHLVGGLIEVLETEAGGSSTF